MHPADSRIYRLAAAGTVDADAPARASGTIAVEAPRAAVWDALAHVENWPTIRADVTDVRGPHEPTPGAPFTWRADGVPVTSAFAVVERPTRLAWVTTAPGLEMAGVYLFDEVGPARTRIRCTESIDASEVAPPLGGDALAEAIRTWLDGIKAYAEGRAATPAA